jgi:cytochrome oxidase Cu insertion factor (SCO1/SenC/PrrC family)
VDSPGGGVALARASRFPARTVLLCSLALVIGFGGTVAIGRVLGHTPAGARTATAQAQYLPPVNQLSGPAPDFSLRDQAGSQVSLSAFRGQLVLVTFMDPQCQTLCPIMAQQLATVEAQLPANVKPTLLVVSAAADRSAADVATFTSHFTWRPGWHWLLGNSAELQAVWATWSVAVGGTDLNHDEVVFVVDPQGRIVAGYHAPVQVAGILSTITTHSPR